MLAAQSLNRRNPVSLRHPDWTFGQAEMLPDQLQLCVRGDDLTQCRVKSLNVEGPVNERGGLCIGQRAAEDNNGEQQLIYAKPIPEKFPGYQSIRNPKEGEYDGKTHASPDSVHTFRGFDPARRAARAARVRRGSSDPR